MSQSQHLGQWGQQQEFQTLVRGISCTLLPPQNAVIFPNSFFTSLESLAIPRIIYALQQFLITPLSEL